MPYLYLNIYRMMDKSLIISLAQKYDENDMSMEAYQKCMQDPDCRARYTENAAARKRQQRVRDRLDPTTETARRAREYEAKDTASRKVLKESGSLDGIAFRLRQQLANLKADAKKILIRKGVVNFEKHPGYQQILRDIGELSHLQNKVMEFARSLQVVVPGQSLAPEKTTDLLNIDSIAKSYLQKFSKYPSVSKTIYDILGKLKEMAGNLVVLTKPVSTPQPIVDAPKMETNSGLDDLINTLEEQSKSLTNVPNGEIKNLELTIRKLRRRKDVPGTIKSLRALDPRIKRQLPVIYDIIAAMY